MRKCYLDNIRWITVVLVVIYHVFYMFNGVATDGVVGPVTAARWQDGILYLLYPWFMVLLFLVSGMCAKCALEKQSHREFIRRRAKKLLVPSTVGLFVFHWIQGAVNMELSGAFEMIPENVPVFALYPIMAISGIGVLWFIQMLWIFSVLLIGVRKLKLSNLAERFPAHPVLLASLGALVWLYAQVLNAPVIAVYRFGIYGFAFFLGYCLFSQERLTDTLAQYGWLYGIIAAVLGIANIWMYYGQNYAVEPVVNSPLSIAYAWFVCLAILGLVKRYGNRTNALALWMSCKSWGLYIFHYLPLSASALALRGTEIPGALIYLLSGASAFLGAWLLYEFISRIPVLRWCVLGIKKEKKNV